VLDLPASRRLLTFKSWRKAYAGSHQPLICSNHTKTKTKKEADVAFAIVSLLNSNAAYRQLVK
jgi:hypothetical protein